MIRVLLLAVASVFFLSPGNVLREAEPGSPPAQEVPKIATVEIMLNAPGIASPESNWEIAYELRLASDAVLWQASKQRQNGNGRERVGDLIKEGGVKKTLRLPQDQKMVFQIPLNPDIQERLRNQPRAPVKIPSGTPSPEEIKLLSEQEMLRQSFQFYSVINIYEGKLKRKFIVPASFSWPYADHPQARFEIKVELNSDGSYNVKTPLPKNTGRQLEIRQ